MCLEFQTHLYAAAISQEKLQFILQQTGHAHTHTHTQNSAGMPEPDKEVIKAAGFLISIITTYLPDFFFFFFSLTLKSICSFIIVVCLSMP